MLVVHHLNESRSQRILWLLEELGLPYEIRFYERDPQTRLAPPALLEVHPLGKSPVLTDLRADGAAAIIESGAITDYVIRRHAGGRLAPDPASPDYDAYQQWLHYAEGSAMLPMLLRLYVGFLGAAGAPLHPRIESEIANHLAYVDAALAGRAFFVGEGLTGADIQMSFVAEVAKAHGKLADYPNLEAWIGRMHDRPAWKAALEKSGPYKLGD